jgi:uncharacterized protein YcbK (DUF882 family)
VIKVSENFVRSEFQCRCGCGFDTVDIALIQILERVRAHFDKPVIVTSGCRCMAHNEAEGGAHNSQHLLGRAADIIVANVDPDDVADYVENINIDGGVGRYSTFTHIDSRCGCARWGS